MQEKRKECRILMGKSEENRQLVRPKHRWKDIILMHLMGVGCGSVDWIDLAQDMDPWRALVNRVINILVP
jgi:hypothetical protein